MRVAALTLDYPPNRFIGSELATHQMLRHLAARGHDVTVSTVTAGLSEPWVWDGITVDPNRKHARQILASADVVITHADISERRIPPIRGKLVGITHNARQPMHRHVARDGWSLIVHNAASTARTLASDTVVPHIVVNPPVDYRDWQVDRSGADAITLVNVTGEKGSDTFYALAERFPDRRFVGVAGGWGELETKDLPNVELLPHGTDMRTVYAQTRILLVPSEHESWGRVAVEAMSSGIPVLASDLPGLRECVGSGGVLIEVDWRDEFERHIRLLDNPDHYRRLSAAARARAVELDPTPQLDRFADCVEALAADVDGPWDIGNLESWVHLDGRRRFAVPGSATSLRFARHPKWEREDATA